MVNLETYYQGKSLLLTGGTGLLGKALLEAAVRKLPDLERIHVLIRPAADDRGNVRSAEERLREEVLGSSAFRGLRREHGDRFDAFVGERVEAVEGDLSREGLGMDPATRERLQERVDVVINCGALAAFDAPLDVALETNALGPLRVLEFARTAPGSVFLAHVSTCYVNPLEGPAFETPLDPTWAPRAARLGEAYDADDEVRAVRRRVEQARESDRLVEAGMERARRRGWSDTYTYTKALGEQLLARHREDVPGLVLRPAIIESALRSPEPGWIEGFRMMDPLIVAFGRGQLVEFPGNPTSLLDIVPVDAVAHALLASVPWTHRGEGPRVYQVATGMENPLLLEDFRDLLEEYLRQVGPARWKGKAETLPDVTFPPTRQFLRKVKYRYLLPLRALHRLSRPLRVLPGGPRLRAWIGSRRSAMEQLYRYARIYGPYAESRARFLSFNTRHLWEALEPDQREKFPFDLRGIDWRRYVHEVHLPGIERHLLGVSDPVTGDAGQEEVEVRPEEAPAATLSAAAGSGAETEVGAPPGPAGAPGGGGGDAGRGGRTAEAAGAAQPETSTPAAVEAPRDWRRVERHLSLSDGADPEEVHAWIAPAYKRLSRRACSWLLRQICRHYLDLECEGRDRLPERGPFIVVCNHTSHVDTGAILAALGPRAPRVHPAAATDYWFRVPGMGRLLNLALGAIPFDRRDRNVTRALALPAEVLRQGHSVIFYPEGGRSPSGELRRFNSSVGLLALATAVPILPVHIAGAYEALPKGDVFPKNRSVRMRVGRPTAVEPYLRRLDRESVSDLARELADQAHRAVASLGEATSS